MPAAFAANVDDTVQALETRHLRLRSVHFVNADADVRYIQFFDADDPMDVTIGTDDPFLVIPMGTSAVASVVISEGMTFTNGLVVGATTTADGATGVTADAFVSITYD